MVVILVGDWDYDKDDNKMSKITKHFQLLLRTMARITMKMYDHYHNKRNKKSYSLQHLIFPKTI